jgi:hypothetical protein
VELAGLENARRMAVFNQVRELPAVLDGLATAWPH